LDTRKPFPEGAPAALTLLFTGLQLQRTVPQSSVLVPHAPLIATLVAQPLAPAVGTRFQSDVPG